jgi:hypothetical protein
MANAKIHINLHQGLIEAEGEETFVAKVYEDFKFQMNFAPLIKTKFDKSANQPAQNNEAAAHGKPKSPRRSKKKSTEVGTETGASVTSYKPNIDATLNLATFKPYIAKHVTKNAAQQILLYAYYLREELKITPCTLDQIFTCMKAAGNKVPTAFGQVFINTRGNDYAYIDFSSANDVTITIKGDNFVNHEMGKAKE